LFIFYAATSPHLSRLNVRPLTVIYPAVFEAHCHHLICKEPVQQRTFLNAVVTDALISPVLDATLPCYIFCLYVSCSSVHCLNAFICWVVSSFCGKISI